MKMRVLTLVYSLLLLTPLYVAADQGMDPADLWEQEVDSEQVKAHYTEGYRYLKAGECKAAIKAFKRVVRADRNHAMAYTNMAYCYRQLNKFKKAIKLYKKALAIEPNLAEAHEYMGGALLALGKVEEAKQHLAILQRLDPKLAEALSADIVRYERS